MQGDRLEGGFGDAAAGVDVHGVLARQALQVSQALGRGDAGQHVHRAAVRVDGTRVVDAAQPLDAAVDQAREDDEACAGFERDRRGRRGGGRAGRTRRARLEDLAAVEQLAVGRPRAARPAVAIDHRQPPGDPRRVRSGAEGGDLAVQRGRRARLHLAILNGQGHLRGGVIAAALDACPRQTRHRRHEQSRPDPHVCLLTDALVASPLLRGSRPGSRRRPSTCAPSPTAC